MKKNHTAQNKTVTIARFSQSVGCCQAQVVFFSIHCVIGGVKTRRVPLFGGAPAGFVGSAPQQRRRGSASVAQRPRGTNGHTQKSAQLCCACAWLEGGRGGEWMVLWSGGGEDGWFWRRKKKGRKERHTANEKNKCTMKKKKTSAAAIIQNKTFNSLS